MYYIALLLYIVCTNYKAAEAEKLAVSRRRRRTSEIFLKSCLKFLFCLNLLMFCQMHLPKVVLALPRLLEYKAAKAEKLAVSLL